MAPTARLATFVAALLVVAVLGFGLGRWMSRHSEPAAPNAAPVPAAAGPVTTLLEETA